MHKPYQTARRLLKTNPVLLLDQPAKVQNIANSMLPRDTGLEFEVRIKEGLYDLSSERLRNSACTELTRLLKILYKPKDLGITLDTSKGESRVRIPKGIKGAIILKNYMDDFHKYFAFNNLSGIHYHVDFPEKRVINRQYNDDEFCDDNDNWVCKSLEHWRYKGTYNRKRFSTNRTWVRLHDEYDTVEYRIGDMSFDYEYLIKRILNVQNITQKLAKVATSKECQQHIPKGKPVRDRLPKKKKYITDKNNYLSYDGRYSDLASIYLKLLQDSGGVETNSYSSSIFTGF